MSKELKYLKEDYENKKKEVDENNKLLEVLLQNSLVQTYRNTYANNEKKKKELETLGVSLAYHEMIECEHAFVRTEILKEMNCDRIVRKPIYHCLKCGLTNAYVVKEINPLLLSKIENNMSYLFERTSSNGIILHERQTCPLDIAKHIYEEIQNRTKNLAISRNQLQMYFLALLSKSDPTYYKDLTFEIRKIAGFDIKDDLQIMQRIELRLRDIPIIENGITCYKVSDFSKDLFEFITTIEKRAGTVFYSVEDISKYQNLVSEELEKLDEKEKNARFDVIAVPNPRAFVVAPDKVQDFKNSKPNTEDVKRNKELAQKVGINNLTQTGDSKKRVKIK